MCESSLSMVSSAFGHLYFSSFIICEASHNSSTYRPPTCEKDRESESATADRECTNNGSTAGGVVNLLASVQDLPDKFLSIYEFQRRTPTWL
uniref:Uncharacterized protein n=1 Tax=Onchocerca volvulus TaxID=6282 RepID=A0A2K6VJ78_ONCVO